MSNQPNVIAKPSARIEAERSQRRRRSDTSVGRLDPLSVAGLKDPNYVYRWINDDPGRVHALTVTDDWDIVTADQLGERADKDKGVGSGVERIVDRVTGKRAVLVKKRKDYYEEDRAKEQRRLDEIDAAIKTGRGLPSSESLQAVDPGHAYVPTGAITISDGRRN